MRIAVLSLTRDRLDYTKHCFQLLHDLGGCEFDHYVWDNGSTDGTKEWLRDEYDPDYLALIENNAGIAVGLNKLLNWAFESRDYDVVVKFDNDCELVTENTLRACCEKALEYPALVSPHILGLKQPPPVFYTEDGLSRTAVIGGIFLAAPAYIFTEYGFRHDENTPVGVSGDDWRLCKWWRQHGGVCGYLDGYEAWHYETTEGQQARYPDYFERKYAEAA